MTTIRGVAQLGERCNGTAEVVSSNLIAPTTHSPGLKGLFGARQVRRISASPRLSLRLSCGYFGEAAVWRIPLWRRGRKKYSKLHWHPTLAPARAEQFVRWVARPECNLGRGRSSEPSGVDVGGVQGGSFEEAN